MIEIGMTHRTVRTVEPAYTAATLKSGLLEVLATPIMIAWMEECCMECVQSRLDEGLGTVGTLVNVTHEAPTPVGCEVTISCFLRQVDGRRLVFAVEASDKGGIIGRGSHERFIVDGAKFQAKCDKKKENRHKERPFMLKITKEHVTDNCSPKNPPAARCQSGDTVVFETRDCYDDRLRGDGTVHEPEKALENPATGPLYVEGAQPGDVLKVHIDKITINSTGLMRCSTSAGAFNDLVEYRKVRQFDTTGENIQFTDKLKLKIDTMIGVIGTAPATDTVMTHTPGSHGGNMDCNKIVEGSTLYLPVNVPGALLSMGDLHALMGDGEVMICGLETGGEVTVTVEVVKGFPMPTPALSCRGKFYSIQSANTLDQASRKASRAMLKFLQQVTPMDVYDCAMLLSLVGDLSVCQIVDPQLTVRMGIDQSILDTYEVKLP